jgi:hypothetical protein
MYCWRYVPRILNVEGVYVKRQKGKGRRRTRPRKPKREQRYSSALSLTSALDWGGWIRPCHGHFTPGKETRYALYGRLGGPQGRPGRARKISPPPGFGPCTVQRVAGCYTDGAIAFRVYYVTCLKLKTGNVENYVIMNLTVCILSRDSSVGIATRYGLDCSGIKFWWGRDCPGPRLKKELKCTSTPPLWAVETGYKVSLTFTVSEWQGLRCHQPSEKSLLISIHSRTQTKQSSFVAEPLFVSIFSGKTEETRMKTN